MTNDELTQAIKIAAANLDACAPMHQRRYAMLLEHLQALLREQKKRAELPAPAPIAPVTITGPDFVLPQPLFAPSMPAPPWDITCGSKAP